MLLEAQVQPSCPLRYHHLIPLLTVSQGLGGPLGDYKFASTLSEESRRRMLTGAVPAICHEALLRVITDVLHGFSGEAVPIPPHSPCLVGGALIGGILGTVDGIMPCDPSKPGNSNRRSNRCNS
jgi:hypothetical protein